MNAHFTSGAINIVNNVNAIKIIEIRKPLGSFIINENSLWVAIDNTTGDAWTEEFTNLDSAIKWFL